MTCDDDSRREAKEFPPIFSHTQREHSLLQVLVFGSRSFSSSSSPPPTLSFQPWTHSPGSSSPFAPSFILMSIRSPLFAPYPRRLLPPLFLIPAPGSPCTSSRTLELEEAIVSVSPCDRETRHKRSGRRKKRMECLEEDERRKTTE